MKEVRLTLVGGPTALIEYGPLRILTDPTFDPPGDYPRPGTSVVLRKLVGPAIPGSDRGAPSSASARSTRPKIAASVVADGRRATRATCVNFARPRST
jgi:hypothetical protein